MGNEKKEIGESGDEFYKEATTKIKVGSAYSDEFPVKVGVHQGSVLLSFLFETVIDVVTEEVRKKAYFMKFFMQTTWFL